MSMQQDGPTVYTPLPGSWDDAANALSRPNGEVEFLRRLALKELYDYSPIEATMRRLTALVRERFGPDVLVVPRGSFASRTALREHVDLDVDLIVPDTWPVPTRSTAAFGPNTQPIGSRLGLDEWKENITFERGPLKEVLVYVWTKLSAAPAATGPAAPLILNLRPDRPVDSWTRSISASTNITLGGGPFALEVDMFIKIKKMIRDQPQAFVVGVDKEGPDHQQRYSTTQFIPSQGQWYGDRILPPVERCALLMLKWWKNEKKLPIKSHHLLSAVNALHELDSNDVFFLPERRFGRFSNRDVVDVMRCVLEYVYDAYTTPCNFLINRGPGLGGTDYSFPQFAWGTVDIMYLQASADPHFQDLLRAMVIPGLIRTLNIAFTNLGGASGPTAWPKRPA